MQNHNDEEPIAAINIVPFVDIILVVLIIFMVTAPLVLKPVIDINLPKSSSGEEAPPAPLNVAVGQDGTLVVNGQPATTESLATLAAQAVAEKPDTAAILQADKTVTLETLTAVIDIIKTAGVKKVAFSIEKK
ncbi:MAG: biopolymer transporter ExbD [Bdellovibrionales bacterium]|jgi:biopolymer transport protein ExbD|nr:biopolymer transporter ExbD [Bdellovibrionales bacterium]